MQPAVSSANLAAVQAIMTGRKAGLLGSEQPSIIWWGRSAAQERCNVHRILKARLQPHPLKKCMASNDPDFESEGRQHRPLPRATAA